MLSLGRLFVLFACLGFVVPAFAQETEDAPAPPGADPFKVPAGNDTVALSNFLRTLASTPPAERTPAGILEHFAKLDKAISEVMSREIETELFTSAATLRLQIYNILPQFGDQTGATKSEKLLEQLRKDERPEVQELVAKLDLANKISNIAAIPAEERQRILNQVSEMIQKAPANDLSQLQEPVQMAMAITQSLEASDETEAAIAAYKQFAKSLSAKNIPELQGLIENMEATTRRLGLLGSTMSFTGITFEGKPFQLDQLRGKVVLVDFWATWCGPCMAELPNVKKLYAAYHEKGFEVVGISLDEDRGTLGDFLKSEEISWITLFDKDPSKQGWENPIARHYGISGIPTAILLDKEGKAVTLMARGEILEEELEKLLGPAE